jgi:outer membrane protein assembly factor BamB
MVYVGSCAGVYYAFDLASGDIRWRHDFNPTQGHATFHGDPLLTDDVLVTGTEALSPVHTRAFDPVTGETLWERGGEWALTRSDVIGVGGLAVGRNQRGQLVALDARTGELRWHVDPEGGRFRPDVAESPAVRGDQLFFSAPDGAVYRVDGPSGDVRWRRALECDVTTSVSVAGGDVYTGCGDGRLFLLSEETGSIRARIALPGALEGRLAVLPDRVVVPGGPRWIGAVDRHLDQVLWEHRPGPPLSVVQPLVWEDVVLTGNGRGELLALDLQTGDVRWIARLEGTIRGLGHHDDTLLVGTVEGVLYAVEAGRLR